MGAPIPFPTTSKGIHPDDLEGIYQQLVKGVGHELVTEANADALARRAEKEGHSVLATELREWKMPC